MGGQLSQIDYPVMDAQIFANATPFKNLYHCYHDFGIRGEQVGEPRD
jgi:hypothetical protein